MFPHEIQQVGRENIIVYKIVMHRIKLISERQVIATIIPDNISEISPTFKKTGMFNEVFLLNICFNNHF